LQKDIREDTLYREAEAIYAAVRRPGCGQISDAAEVSVSPDRLHAIFAGTVVDELEGLPPTCICRADLNSGDTKLITFGPNVDRLPKYSPDGYHVAFLSDRHKAGDFQLYLLDSTSGTARPTPTVEGWVEYLHWSPDGNHILLGVAGHGADVAGGQGSVSGKRDTEDLPSWMPTVDTGEEVYRWRRAWVYDLTRNAVRQVGPPETNVWEAVWYGSNAIAAVVSPGPSEGLWYSARLAVIQVENGNCREVYAPKDQLGCPAGSPSGQHLAVVEAICSDRGLVAGDLRLIETSSGKVTHLDTLGVDVTYTEWRSDRLLLLAGHRGFETVVGRYDVVLKAFQESWASPDLTTGGLYATVSGIDETGDCVLVGESFGRSPELGVIRNGTYRTVKSFDLGYAAHATSIGAIEQITWKAPDGLDIQGWLLRPRGVVGRCPLIMHIHGGPVWHWRPRWLGRTGLHILISLKRGYAAFLPNPRGSAGRGQEFAKQVLGDVGGVDAVDLLAGIDYLVNRGIADKERLGVTGVSYGGFMTSWLITQDSRFAASVAVAPHTNYVTEHLLSNIPHFVSLFLADTYANLGGQYYRRSPVIYASKVKTPTLNICGALDRCTPPEEAIQFHRALLENGVKSVLVTYPEEGHGVRRWPAAIDYAARVAHWFDEHF
jgi:dipeptidyl aminopeptidase/acylaminoacyl peptidase